MYKLFRTLLLPVAALFAFTAATAQNVSWKSSVEHLEGDVYRIVLEASIPAPYHMYDMGPYEGGPNATAIVFTPGDGVTARRRRGTAFDAGTPLRQDIRDGDRDLRRQGPLRPAGKTRRGQSHRQGRNRMDDLRRGKLHAPRRHGTDGRADRTPRLGCS